MPSIFAALDHNLPRFTGEESLEKKVSLLQDYQYQLLEQLRWGLAHLDTRNMNMDAMNGWASEITEPLSARIEDAEGNITRLGITAQGLAAQIRDANGNITALQATAQGLQTTVSNQAGQINSLQQTASTFAVNISNLQTGQAASLKMGANGLIYSDNNGQVTINGGQIEANTVKVNTLYGSNVYFCDVYGNVAADIAVTGASSTYQQKVVLSSGAFEIITYGGSIYLRSTLGPALLLGRQGSSGEVYCQLSGGPLLIGADSYGYSLPSSGTYGQVFFLLES